MKCHGSFDLQSLRWLTPMLLRESGKGEHVFEGVSKDLCGVGQACPERDQGEVN